MTDRTVTVAQAKITWGYYTAVALGLSTVTRTDGQWSVVGEVVTVDELRLSRQPLKFSVTYRRGSEFVTETLPVVEMPQIAEGVLRARLGPPEVPDGYHRQAQDRQAVTQ